MKILNEGLVTPEILTNIDSASNIIMCLHPSERDSIREIENFPDMFQLRLSRDINLSSSNIDNISTGVLATTIRPNLKISIPVGTILIFNDFINSENQDIFWKTYKSFENYNSYKDDILHNHIIENIKAILYIDTIRMRDTKHHMVLKKDVPVLNFYFNYYSQTQKEISLIENIYLIIDENVYTNFINIF